LTEKYGFHELDFQFRDLAAQLAAGRRRRGHADPIHVAPRGELVLRDLIDEADALGSDRGAVGPAATMVRNQSARVRH